MRDRLVIAQIDLHAFRSNFINIKKLVGENIKVMAIVKGNAYGHGLVRIAQEAESLGADYLGVACLYEARRLRENGIKLPILILGYTDRESLEDIVRLDITPTIIDREGAKRLNELGKLERKIISMHIKVDTGMHRFGLSPSEALSFIESLKIYKNIFIEGVFTHFAESDAINSDLTLKQVEVFNKFIVDLELTSDLPPCVHAANSAAILRFPQAYFSMVRAGKALYGPLLSKGVSASFIPKQIISLKTYIVQIRALVKGDSVGYNRTFIAKNDMKVAIIPVGYADGFRRAPRAYGEVLVNGQRCQIVGNVSMDQATIDVTNVTVGVGDEVILIGQSGTDTISVSDVAEKLGTNNYEVVTSLSERVEREYI